MTSVELVVIPQALGLPLSEPAHQDARETEVDDLAIDHNAARTHQRYRYVVTTIFFAHSLAHELEPADAVHQPREQTH